MNAEFENLVAVVTGGASGIGAETVRVLMNRGARVAALDREFSTATDGVLNIHTDVTDNELVLSAINDVVAQWGRIDIVINNAGISAQGSVADNPDDEWLRVLDVNLIGMVRVSRAALPHLRNSPHAVIVNTGSIAATAGLQDRALYSASKGAVLALSRAMAADHLREGIRVNCVNPGTADTPWVSRLLAAASDPVSEIRALGARQPHGRLVSAAEVADAIAYLASPRSGSTTGVGLAVDGGMNDLRLRSATQ